MRKKPELNKAIVKEETQVLQEEMFAKSVPRIYSNNQQVALGMPKGAPPPWLINMQRYGPPTSYLHFKIPRLNAPISPRASYSYHSGGQSKPPANEYDSLLDGDVFGVLQQDQSNYEEKSINKTKHWGDLEEEEEEDVEFAQSLCSRKSIKC